MPTLRRPDGRLTRVRVRGAAITTGGSIRTTRETEYADRGPAGMTEPAAGRRKGGGDHMIRHDTGPIVLINARTSLLITLRHVLVCSLLGLRGQRAGGRSLRHHHSASTHSAHKVMLHEQGLLLLLIRLGMGFCLLEDEWEQVVVVITIPKRPP